MVRLLSGLIVSALFATASVAQSPCHAENDGPNFADGVSVSSAYIGIQFTAPTDFTATSLEVFTGETNTTMGLQLRAHDANTNRPAATLSAGTMSVGSANGWYAATLAAGVPLQAGQIYWFVWNTGAGGQSSLDTLSVGLGQPYTPSFDGGQTWGSLFQFADRHWKFRINGACGGPPIVYCTSGTTSNGCAATIAASAQPSASFANSCTITISNVEGQKTGIIFYGLTQLPQPWCVSGGGTSFLCVKTPTMRTGPLNSGGTTGQCNGQLALDWNAFQAANPSALGVPWSASEEAYVQGWFRDPSSCKTTSLSNAVELTYVP